MLPLLCKQCHQEYETLSDLKWHYSNAHAEVHAQIKHWLKATDDKVEQAEATAAEGMHYDPEDA